MATKKPSWWERLTGRYEYFTDPPDHFIGRPSSLKCFINYSRHDGEGR